MKLDFVVIKIVKTQLTFIRIRTIIQEYYPYSDKKVVLHERFDTVSADDVQSTL